MASSSSPFPPPNPTPKISKAPPAQIQIPTMSQIMDSSKAQGLRLQLKTLGPFFRVQAEGEGGAGVGRAEGVIRVWFGGKILHLDSMRLTRETLAMDRSIFGLGLFLGAVAVRHGFDRGCGRAGLLAINDSPLYHSKLVRFYARMGFKVVHEVDGSSMGDLAHMLVWGGRGTRMDADVKKLLMKWGKRDSCLEADSLARPLQSNSREQNHISKPKLQCLTVHIMLLAEGSMMHKIKILCFKSFVLLDLNCIITIT